MTENASETAGPAGVHLSSGKLAQMIDISAVQAFHTEDDIRSLANLALKRGFIPAHALRATAQVTHPRGQLDTCWWADRLPFRRSHDCDQTRGSALARRSWRRQVGHDDQSWAIEIWRPLLRPKRNQGRRRDYRTHFAKR
jgi:hypothetical protein